MRRDIPVILACGLFTLTSFINTLGAADQDPYYCPPGAKFCPAPGMDNSVAIDTHFGIDARTGQMTRYTGSVHPDEVANQTQDREIVIMTVPSPSVENRYVPYPGAEPAPPPSYVSQGIAHAPVMYNGPQSAPAQPIYAQPSSLSRNQYAAMPVYATAQYQEPLVAAAYQTSNSNRSVESPQSRRVRDEAASEVANRQATRSGGAREATEADRIPWWKGGMWRNRGDRADDDEKDSSSRSSSSNSNESNSGDSAATRSRADGPRALSASEDMWGDEEYTGYNPDGSVASGGGNPNSAAFQAAGQAFNDTFSQPQQFSAAPYNAQSYAPDPYGQPYAPQPGGGFVGDTYTLPDQAMAGGYQSGPSYVGGGQPSFDPATYGGSYQPEIITPSAAGTTSSYAATSTYSSSSQEYIPPLSGSDPYAQPQTYTSQSGSFLPPPSTYDQGFPTSTVAAPAGGSAQFEHAVGLVKANNFSEAKSLLSTETRSNPSFAPAWRWLADCYYNLLELDDAIQAYERSRSLDPNDYYASRGQGFAYLHRGHELWRQMQDEVARGQKDLAADTFSRAHDNYKKSLDLLGACLRRAPNDSEAIYGEAMAAEGASRKLYSNAVSYLKLGPENRERAELFAENCLTVINKGIERARDRAKASPGESGPRALLGGLYLRKAILYQQLGRKELALIELKNSHDVQQSILDEIDKNNASAQKGVRECENYWKTWGGPSAA